MNAIVVALHMVRALVAGYVGLCLTLTVVGMLVFARRKIG